MQCKLHENIHTPSPRLLMAHRRLASTRCVNRSVTRTASVRREHLPEYHGARILPSAYMRTARLWIYSVRIYNISTCKSRQEAHAPFPTASAGMTYNACDIPNTVEPSDMRPLVYIPFVVQLCFFTLRIASIWQRKKQPWGLDDITFYISSVSTTELPSEVCRWARKKLQGIDTKIKALLLAWLPTLILGAYLLLASFLSPIFLTRIYRGPFRLLPKSLDAADMEHRQLHQGILRILTHLCHRPRHDKDLNCFSVPENFPRKPAQVPSLGNTGSQCCGRNHIYCWPVHRLQTASILLGICG